MIAPGRRVIRSFYGMTEEDITSFVSVDFRHPPRAALGSAMLDHPTGLVPKRGAAPLLVSFGEVENEGREG